MNCSNHLLLYFLEVFHKLFHGFDELFHAPLLLLLKLDILKINCLEKLKRFKRTELVHSYGEIRSILGKNPLIKIKITKYRTEPLSYSANSHLVSPLSCSVKSHSVSIYEHIISNHC